MRWVSVEDRLPEDGQAVLVRYGRDNWLGDHKLADGSLHKQWRWQAARFIRGRTAEQLARENMISVADQHGNNLVPYCWNQFGPGVLFGQDVTHWAAITDPAAGSAPSAGWIKIKDRLPEKHQYVLLLADRYWNTPDGVPDMKVTASGYLAEHGTLYWSVFGERGFDIDAFTHWMPIPDVDV